MEDEEDIKVLWSDKYGSITVISFMVYGMLGTRDNYVLNIALQELIGHGQYAQLFESIDRESAEALNIQQGLFVEWIFPNKIDNTKEIINLISNGLTFQRLKHEHMGVTTDVYERTT